MKQPPILKPLGLTCGGNNLHSSSSPSSFHTSSSSSFAVDAKTNSSLHQLAAQQQLPPSSVEGGSYAAKEDISFCCDADEYGDLRSRSRSRGEPRDVRKKSNSSQLQYLRKQASASPSPSRMGELQRNYETQREMALATVSRPRKREDRRKEDSLAAASFLSTASRAANESRMTTSQDSNSDRYWPSTATPIAAVGKITGYGNNWKQQQRRQGVGIGT